MPSFLRKTTLLRILFLEHIYSVSSGAAIPSLATSKQSGQTFGSNIVTLGFTVSRLEQQERGEDAGIWVEQEEFQLEEDFDEFDYEFDEIEEDDDFNDVENEKNKPRQKGFSTDIELEKKSEKDDDDEHPMRTDEWLVNVSLSPILLPGNSESVLFPNSNVDGQLSRLKQRNKSKRRKQQIMKFAKNGFVVLVEDTSNTSNSSHNKSANNHDPNRVTKIGKWKIDTSGVSWSIPVHVRDDCTTLKRTTLHYHADIHLSKFQEQPRMFKGVITRDHFQPWSLPLPFAPKIEKNIFRPVIATFTAQGIGRDTADTSYKSRGFGLNSCNKSETAKSVNKQ